MHHLVNIISIDLKSLFMSHKNIFRIRLITFMYTIINVHTIIQALLIHTNVIFN